MPDQPEQKFKAIVTIFFFPNNEIIKTPVTCVDCRNHFANTPNTLI